MDSTTRWFRKKQLAERYSTSTRTVDRWIEGGKFPPPDGRLPNGAPLWGFATVEDHERKSVVRATAREGATA
jgi:hypothetical protein